MVHRLRGCGIRVRRLYEDLVTRAAIASRTGMTRQAVGNWIRGDRKAATPFPEPYQLAGGGLWLWGEVSAWIGEEEIAYPTRRDYPAVNSIIDREPDGFEKVAIGWLDPAEPMNLSPSAERREFVTFGSSHGR